MKIFLLSAGTRGDVQPFVALGVALKRAGHEVTVCTHRRFGSFVRDYGLSYAFMNDDILDLLDTPAGRTVMESAGRARNLLRYVQVAKAAWPAIRRSLDEAWDGAQEAEAIVCHPKAIAGYHIAEKLDVPVFLCTYLPFLLPTRYFPNPLAPYLKLGSWYNRLSYRLLPFLTAPLMGMVNRWRRETLGLPTLPWRRGLGIVRRDGRAVPVLHSFSRHLVPPPNDWPETSEVTGFWFLEHAAGYEPPLELTRFLEASDPPVYVGFGSMATRDPQRLTDIAVNALRRTGRRGILATGWGALVPENTASILAVEDVPHQWLFPRVAVVVHHGGAGTTAAGLRAGKPTVICPFFGDQPFWGRRVHALGAGPEPIPRRKLTTERLAAAIDEAATDETILRRATELGEKIRREGGVDTAVEFLNRHLETAG